MAEIDWDQIAGKILGTADGPAYIAEQFGVPEDDVEHQLSLHFVETCPMCGWWVASSEINDEGCEGCRGS